METGDPTITREHAVVVVGAGPAGMMLAAELTLAGTDVVVVERRPGHQLESPRSRGLHSRTIEVFDQRGVADRFLSAGRPMQVQAFAGVPLDIGDFPTRHPYGLALVQSEVERIMAAWMDELGVCIVRAREVIGFEQHAEWGDGLRVIEAACDGPWELPVIGRVDAPSAVLVRPDGYVAHVGAATGDVMRRAVARWFGAAAAGT